MDRARPFYDLEGFARLFLALNRIGSYRDIRTERLADVFRQLYQLGPFPTYDDLAEVCRLLAIPIEPLHIATGDLHAVNVWPTAGRPEIYLRPDVLRKRAETNLCHELREVIENALKLVEPRYRGLDTRDHKTMDPESNQFAGCLLMQAHATRERLAEIGYDFLLFSQEKERSLPSVVVRAQELYPANGEEPGPVAGLWLFEAPWVKVAAGTATIDDLRVIHRAHLRGFSTSKSGKASARRARLVFPSRGDKAAGSSIVLQAVEDGHPTVHDLGGFDMFGDHDFLLAAEPLFVGGVPWRALVTAVRKDCESMLIPWLDRLAQAGAERESMVAMLSM